MTITSAIANSFKVEILQGGHNFNDSSGAPTGNAFKLALFTEDATLSKSTTQYTAPTDASADPTNTKEVSTTSTGYPSGGNALTASADPVLSGANTTTYISQYFPQGLLYACLVEAYSFLKGPTDMLTLYEQKYKTELQKFAAMQLGRRRRDDYTDGTIRIPIESAPQ